MKRADGPIPIFQRTLLRSAVQREVPTAPHPERQTKTFVVGAADIRVGDPLILAAFAGIRTEASMVHSLVQVRNWSLSLFAGPTSTLASSAGGQNAPSARNRDVCPTTPV